MKTFSDKIILGTVKLGDPNYGFSSKQKLINHSIFLSEVVNCGIDTFDTSPRYNDSEKVIGEFMSNTKDLLYIDTKIDGLLVNDKNSIKKIYASVNKSLNILNIDKINTIYLHQNELEIISDKYIREGLENLKIDKLVSNIGISVYDCKEIEFGLMSEMYNVIQLPINIIDMSYYNRYVKNNKLDVKFNARSVFLQGFLLNYRENKIKNGDIIIKFIKHLELECKQNGFEIIDLIKSIIFNLEGVNGFIIGSTNINNIKNNITASSLKIPDYLVQEVLEFSNLPKNYSNPRNW